MFYVDAVLTLNHQRRFFDYSLKVVTFFICALLISSCDSESTPQQPSPPHNVQLNTQKSESRPVEKYLGDLDQFKQHGQLRVLFPKWEAQSYLPRNGFPAEKYQVLARRLSDTLGLEFKPVPVDHFEELIPKLLAGEGDLIATNLTVTDSRKDLVLFTEPLEQVYEQLVVGEAFSNVKAIEDLKQSGLNIGVPKESSFLGTLVTLQQQYPSITIKILESNLEPDDIVNLIVSGEIDASIMDSNAIAVIQTYQPHIRVAFNVTEQRHIAWAMRPESKKLLSKSNDFLLQTALAQHRSSQHQEDWPFIKKQKTLRLLTRNHPASYFIWRGELMGFEYELIKRFADKEGLTLEIIVPPRDANILQWLVEGRGDVAASVLTVTEERKNMGVSFTRPYQQVTEILVGNRQSTITQLSDLTDQLITVHPLSSFYGTLSKLQDQGTEFGIQEAKSAWTTMDLLQQINEGKIDLTVADSHLLGIELVYKDNIKPLFSINGPVDLAWATRQSNPELLKKLNQYLKKEYKSTFFNLTYHKYFHNTKQIQKTTQHRIRKDQALSPWDNQIQKLTEQYQFNWRLVTAQIYQESKFNPKARSYAGAVGLMQVLPRTANEMGYQNLTDPETGIRAGVQYMDWIRDRFSENIPIEERMRFILASYNAGYGHVHDARRIAKQKGWNQDQWYGHVEQAMLLLEKPEYARQARFGYCRGTEPVNYVREIEQRYQAYLAAHQLQDAFN